ncbi:TIGR03084 family metal-binding protein [Nocardioides sp. Bht2]|uniref:TIGR03084 family metal-binding protein n=1 Tax=Nocardioides sp. Bht2 TaxID=3392297 RepID=UPI0039B41F08
MSDLLGQVLADLDAEGALLEALVADRPDADWRRPTPAAGWDVAAQIAHLAWTDESAVIAATDRTAWDALVLEAMQDPEGFVDNGALRGGAVGADELLVRWQKARADLQQVLRALPPGTKLPWYGPPMSATSMATARFMETWAHSRDVHEALGAEPQATDRIKHVAHLAVRTRDFAFHTRGLQPPTEAFYIDLLAPSGERWVWGEPDAVQQVTGSALDLCLLATQRVNRADTDLKARGDEAEAWLGIAQCFAGPPGTGRDATEENQR